VKLTSTDETGSLFSEEELSLQEYAFDEMNIVEMPIALLTRDTSGIYEIPLSAAGQSTLACSLEPVRPTE